MIVNEGKQAEIESRQEGMLVENQMFWKGLPCCCCCLGPAGFRQVEIVSVVLGTVFMDCLWFQNSRLMVIL